MDKETRNKIRVCSHLLPDPSGEVVRQLLDELDTVTLQRDDLLEALSAWKRFPLSGERALQVAVDDIVGEDGW